MLRKTLVSCSLTLAVLLIPFESLANQFTAATKTKTKVRATAPAGGKFGKELFKLNPGTRVKILAKNLDTQNLSKAEEKKLVKDLRIWVKVKAEDGRYKGRTGWVAAKLLKDFGRVTKGDSAVPTLELSTDDSAIEPFDDEPAAAPAAAPSDDSAPEPADDLQEELPADDDDIPEIEILDSFDEEN